MPLRVPPLNPLLLTLTATMLALPAAAAADKATPLHYTVTLRLPANESDSLTVDERLELPCSSGPGEWVLDAAGLELSAASVTVDGRRMVLKQSAEAGRGTIRLPVAGMAGKRCQLELRLRSAIGESPGGLYRVMRGGQTWFFVDGAPGAAASGFIARLQAPQAQPTIELTVIAPPGAEVLSGAPLRQRVDEADATRRFEFATAPLLPGSGLALAVGPFVERSLLSGSTPIKLFTAAGSDDRRAAFALRSAVALFKRLQRIVGQPAPVEQVVLVLAPSVVPLHHTPNSTGVVLCDERILLDEQIASPRQQRQVLMHLAHELAHQWFGGAVRMRQEDAWLDETLAAWAARSAVDELAPEAQGNEWATDDDDVLPPDPREVDALATGLALASKEAREHLIEPLYRRKGGALLRMMARQLGAGAMRNALPRYLKGPPGREVKAEEFWRALAAPQLGKAMARWAQQSGLPLLSPAVSCENEVTRITFKQERFLASGSTASGTWPVPMCLRYIGAKGKGERCALLDESAASLRLPGCLSWMTADTVGAGYYRLRYPAADLGALWRGRAAALPAERAALLDDAWALARAGELPLPKLLELLAALDSETDAVVLSRARDVFAFLGSHVLESGDAVPFSRLVSSVFRPALDKVGWTAAPGDPAAHAQVRAIASDALARVAADRETLERMRPHLLGQGPPLAASLAEVAWPAVARHGDARVFERVLAALATAPVEQRQVLVMALGSFTSPSLVERALRLVLDGRTLREHEVLPLLAVALNGPAAERVARFVVANHEALVARLPPRQRPALFDALGALCTSEAHSLLARHFAAPPPGAEHALARALERIENCTASVARQRPALARWLKSQSTPP